MLKNGDDVTHLSFKIVANERQRVVEGLHGSKLNIRRRFLLPCSMHDCGQNLIRAHGQHIRVLEEKKNVGQKASNEWDPNPCSRKGQKTLTSTSQIKPIALSVDCRRGTLVPVLTKRKRISIRSGHWPCGSSTVAIAATLCAATVPALTCSE
jgi:hypothetical protein